MNNKKTMVLGVMDGDESNEGTDQSPEEVKPKDDKKEEDVEVKD